MKYLKGKRMRLGLCLGLIATFIIGMASWAQTTMVADAPTAGDTAASVAAAADTAADTDASGQPAGKHLS